MRNEDENLVGSFPTTYVRAKKAGRIQLAFILSIFLVTGTLGYVFHSIPEWKGAGSWIIPIWLWGSCGALWFIERAQDRKIRTAIEADMAHMTGEEDLRKTRELVGLVMGNSDFERALVSHKNQILGVDEKERATDWRMVFRNAPKALNDQLPLSRAFRNFFMTRNAWGLFHKNSHTNRSNGKAKVKYNTRQSADKAALSMEKKNGYKYSVYKCVFCDGFHIGRNRTNMALFNERKKEEEEK